MKKYTEAGVDIIAGEQFVESFIEDMRVQATQIQKLGCKLLDNDNDFASVIELPSPTGAEPQLLVSATDGIGTKLLLAEQFGAQGDFFNLGLDLVAMCVNDVICTGARPLSFLDYLACSKLEKDRFSPLIAGIIEGCRRSGCALVGGESAEMPDVYQDGHFDVAGFAQGLMLASERLEPHKQIAAGQVVIAISSSGPHSNGYSLIRKIVANQPTDVLLSAHDKLGGRSIVSALLAPTIIYVRALEQLRFAQVDVVGLAHVTGGGIRNLARIFDHRSNCVIELSSEIFNQDYIFAWLAEHGQLSLHEMLEVFNCGIGMYLICPQLHAQNALAALGNAGYKAFCAGVIKDRQDVSTSHELYAQKIAII